MIERGGRGREGQEGRLRKGSVFHDVCLCSTHCPIELLIYIIIIIVGEGWWSGFISWSNLTVCV